MAAPKLTLVTNDVELVSSPDWLDFPQTVRARSPENRAAQCRVRVSRSDVLKRAVNRRRQPAFEFWGCIKGKAPPVLHAIPNADEELTTLYDAHALFQGIKRGVGDDDEGESILIYILRPRWTFRYELLPPLVFTTKEDVPDDALFAAYVALDHPTGGKDVVGVLTHWQFVRADAGDRSVPAGAAERYRKRIW